MKSIRIRWALVTTVIALSIIGFTQYQSGQNIKIEIAVAGNLDNPTILNSANLYLKNNSKKAKNLTIKLVGYDDKKNKDIAKKNATAIAKSNALAVIGHGWSSSSIAASNIYKKAEIIAISPTSTHVNVTKNNPWMFRTIFNDEFQGQYMAHYSNKILKKNPPLSLKKI